MTDGFSQTLFVDQTFSFQGGLAEVVLGGYDSNVLFGKFTTSNMSGFKICGFEVTPMDVTPTPTPTPICENNALKVDSGWNTSTTYSHPGHSNNMAGTNSKSFNSFGYNGRGFSHPSCENKNNIFDGDWNTHSGDYWAKNYGGVVWEKIHVGEVGCGTFRIKLARRRPGKYNDEILARVSILYRKPGQTWTGTKYQHYFENQNSGGVRVWTTTKNWEGFSPHILKI